MHRALALVVLVGCSAVLPALCSPTASAASGTPTTPPSKRVAIFSNFYAEHGPMLEKLRNELVKYGYAVDPVSHSRVYKKAGQVHVAAGSATYATLKKIAAEHPGILILDTHGIKDTTLDKQAQKLLHNVLGFLGFPDVVKSPLPPSLLVQYFDEGKPYPAEKQFFDTTYKSDKDAGRIVPTAADVAGPGTAKEAASITGKGINALFGHQIGIVYLAACESDVVGGSFNAKTVVSYSGDVCVGDSSQDLRQYFNGLEGRAGLDHRNSQTAPHGSATLGGTGEPVVLAPAVREVAPAKGQSLKPGTTTHVKVTFDSKIKTVAAGSVVSVSGCKAKITKGSARWSNDNQVLTFDVELEKKSPKGQATITVFPKTVVGSGGAAIQLDGNKNGSGASGVYPNRDAYNWTLKCSGGSTPLSFEGSADGFSLHGPIQAANSSVRCTALSGDVTGVFINGFLKDDTQVGFEIDASSGSLGPGGSANGTMTLDLFPGKPPKLDHAGAAGGGQFGTGSGSVTVNGTSGGSIDATLDDGVHVTGTWTCDT